MELGALRQIIAWAQAAQLRTLEIGEPGCSVRLSLAEPDPSASPAVQPDETVAADAAGLIVAAHVTGVFLAAHPMRAAPFVRPTDAVKAGDILGLLKIGRIYAPVSAPRDGVVVRCLVATGALVDFGTALLALRPHVP